MSLSAEEIKKLELALAPLQKDVTLHKDGFQHSTNSQPSQTALVIDVANKPVLKTLLLKIQVMNREKADADRIILRTTAGDADCATPVTEADIVVRLTGPEFAKISRVGESNVMRIGASVQNDELDILLSGFADLIRGVTIMLENGQEERLERSHPDFEVIMSANNGLFGIIMDIDIEWTPRKKLESAMENRSFAELMEEIKRVNETHEKPRRSDNAPTELNYQQLCGNNLPAFKEALERWHLKYHLPLNKSILLNPLFCRVLGYPVPNLVATPGFTGKATPDKDGVEIKDDNKTNVRKSDLIMNSLHKREVKGGDEERKEQARKAGKGCTIL